MYSVVQSAIAAPVRRTLNNRNIIPEAEFFDVIGKKVFRVFLLAIHLYESPLLTDFTPPLPLEQKLFETGFVM
jgi:hypothetical protein